jgi:hypothetical protein
MYLTPFFCGEQDAHAVLVLGICEAAADVDPGVFSDHG